MTGFYVHPHNYHPDHGTEYLQNLKIPLCQYPSHSSHYSDLCSTDSFYLHKGVMLYASCLSFFIQLYAVKFPPVAE